MTRPGPEKVGAFVRQHREELTRIWRLARAGERPDVFPGLLDGVIAPFFDTAGGVLGAGEAADTVWRELAGLVRWPSAIAPGELDEEWKVVGEVLSAACESVNADPAVADWLDRAANACRSGTASLTDRKLAPPGIVVALVYSATAPRKARGEIEGIA